MIMTLVTMMMMMKMMIIMMMMRYGFMFLWLRDERKTMWEVKSI